MSQQPNAYGNPEVQLYQEPERTSILAILSLVFGVLGCCGGVTSIFAVVFSIGGMFGISRSKGRVGGMGLAIGGLIVGLLTLAFYVGLYYAVNYGSKMYGSTAQTVLMEIQDGNYDAARAAMTSPMMDLSDEEFALFHDQIAAEFGQFVGMPENVIGLVKGYMQVGQQIQPYQGRTGFAPMPAQFDTGWVLVIYIMDPSGQGPLGENGMPLPEGLILIGRDGTEYAIPVGANTSTWPGTGSGSDADSDAESPTPDTDNAEEEVIEDPEEGP